MLNQNLPNSELKESLEEFLDPLDYLLDELAISKRIPILYDRKLRGRIHHALNISSYGKPEFRHKLLSYADDGLLQKYLIELGLIRSDDLKMQNRDKLIANAARTPWRNDEKTVAFVKIFGYEDELVPVSEEAAPDEEAVARHVEPLKSLYDYQSKIFFDSISLVENRYSRLIIQMPTGSGKTRTAMEIISKFLNQGILIQNERQVLWMAEKEELCEQAIESFKHIWAHTGRKNSRIYRLFGSSRISNFETSSIIVATYSKLRARIKAGEELPKPDLIICDEAHSAIAPTYKHSIEAVRKDGTRIVGLTATPIRGIQSQENDDLMEFFNHVLIDIETDDNAIGYLQQKGYLSHCIPKTIDTNITFRMNMEMLRLLSLERDLPASFLNNVARNNQRNVMVAKLLKELAERRIKVLYFAPSVFQSKLMCAFLIALEFSAAHVDGDTPRPYRRDTVEKFRDNKINVLCNFDVFSAGFDDPGINAVVIARPTTSIVVHQQMIGRGMRGPKMGGHETFELYRIKDTLPDIEVADQYFSDIWK